MNERHGWKFRHIGGGNISQAIKTNYIEYGELPWDKYLLTIDTFAVGIVPLEPSGFNDSKSYLKGLEYASLGVPFVASPTSEYVKFNRYGLGVLASREYEWYVELRKFDDKSYLAEMSQKHRELARNFAIDLNAWRWEEAWQEAIRRKSGRKFDM